MANSALVTLADAKDVGPNLLVGVFTAPVDPTTTANQSNVFGGNGDYYTTELRIAEKVVLQAGYEPSYAIVAIPMAKFGAGNWDESTYSVAFKATGPGGQIQLRSRASVYMRSADGQRAPLLSGTVVKIAHGVERDDLILAIYDDRYLLRKVTVFGQAQYDPHYKIHGFVANAPCIFNQRGFPDCIDTVYGPRFTPTVRFGWATNPLATNSERLDEGAAGKSTSAARYWTVADAVTYLRDMHAIDGQRPGSGGYYGNQKVSKELTWPKEVSQMLLTTGASRRLHNVSVEGLDLCAALSKIAERSGPYRLYCVPGKGGFSDNENAGDGPINSTAFYAAFRAAFEGTVNGMATAFNNSYGVFVAAFYGTLAVLERSFNAFQNQLGTYDNNQMDRIKRADAQFRAHMEAVPAADQADPEKYKKALAEGYKQYLAEMGEILENNPGMFTLPNGAVLGGGSATDTVGESTSGVGVARPVNSGANSLKGMAMAAATGGGGTSTIVFIDMRAPSKGDGIIIPKLYGLDLPQAMRSDSTNEGHFVESIEDYYDDCCIIGDAPVYESLFSTDSTDSENYYLEPAWSQFDEECFKGYISHGTGPNTQVKFDEACLLFPLVYAAYRVKKGFMAKFAGTKYEDALVNQVHPRIRPTLISGYQQDLNNPRNWIPRPITIEYYDADTAAWKAASQYDNLQVSQDGQYFMVTALRDNGPGKTWRSSGGSTDYDGDYMEKINIRATLAIELDWRISALGSAAAEEKDPNKTAGRLGKGGPFTYTTLAQETDYVDWLRYGSKPAGQLIPAAYRQFPDRATASNELFSDKKTKSTGRLVEHAKARFPDVKRIGHSGTVKFPIYRPGFVPGRGVSEVKGSDIPFIGVVSTVIFDLSGMTVEMTATAPQGIPDGVGQY